MRAPCRGASRRSPSTSTRRRARASSRCSSRAPTSQKRRRRRNRVSAAAAPSVRPSVRASGRALPAPRCVPRGRGLPEQILEPGFRTPFRERRDGEGWKEVASAPHPKKVSPSSLSVIAKLASHFPSASLSHQLDSPCPQSHS